jgi:hypothetical protein
MPRCRRPLARRARTRRPQLRRGLAAWSATRTSASQQNWLLMNRHNHGAPGSHSKRKQDDDKRSDFHGNPQAVNHEHECGAGRLIISRRRVVCRHARTTPLNRRSSEITTFWGLLGIAHLGFAQGVACRQPHRSCSWKSFRCAAGVGPIRQSKPAGSVSRHGASRLRQHYPPAARQSVRPRSCKPAAAFPSKGRIQLVSLWPTCRRDVPRSCN